MVAFTKTPPRRIDGMGSADTILVVVNTDHQNAQDGGVVRLDLGAAGFGDGTGWIGDVSYEVHDLLSDQRFTWHGADNYVRLGPVDAAAGHVFSIHRLDFARSTERAHMSPATAASAKGNAAKTAPAPVAAGKAAGIPRPGQPQHTPVQNAPDWFRDVVIYQLHVRSFADSNADGVGDFDGLISRLDYLVDLGIDAIWLLPFMPSPLRDDGYDIADYESVNPAYGDMASFKRFLRAAHDRGLKVIVELVMNHTSDQHPWFQRARKAPARQPLPRLLRLERHHREVRGRADHLPGLRELELGVGRGGAELLLAPLLLASARPELRQPRCARVMFKIFDRWFQARRRRCPPRRDPVPLRAGGDELREPRRDPRVPQVAAQLHGREVPGADAARRGQPVAGGRGRVLR